MRIYPSAGLLVRDPVKRDFLPDIGREVPDGDLYWLRRLGCNDVTSTPPKTTPTPDAVAPSSKPEKPPKAPAGSDAQ